jgi:drug/metabolite transporter (DMT)-like permease
VNLLPYALGFLASVANASTNVMQRAANRTESPKLQFSFRLIMNLIGKPLWLLSILTMIASFLLQASALGLGTLAAVEPILVLELPLTLLGARLFLGGRLGRREWLAIAVMTVGTIGLIVSLDPRGGRQSGVGWLVWVIAVTVTGAAGGLALWLGHRWQSPGRRAGVLGVGAGIGFGLTAALIKGMTGQYGDGGIAAVVTTWQLYAAIVAGVFAFWTNQNAINAGRLAVAQPGVTLSDPYVSIVWGALVFAETMRTGPWIAAAVACAGAMSGGAVILAKSPALSGERARSEPGQPAARRTPAQGHHASN